MQELHHQHRLREWSEHTLTKALKKELEKCINYEMDFLVEREKPATQEEYADCLSKIRAWREVIGIIESGDFTE